MRIKRIANDYKAAGVRIKGRQLLFLLHKEFTLTESAQSAYGLTDLVQLKGPKGGDIEDFLTSWFVTLGILRVLPADDVLASMLYSKLESQTAKLEQELRDFDRAAPENVKRTHEHFIKAIEDSVERKRHKQIRNEYVDALN